MTDRTSDAVYEDRILAFVDILGFKNLIAQSETDRAVAVKLLKLLSSVKGQTTEFRGNGFEATLFSDTICLSILADNASFSGFCGGLSLISISLLGMGYPIRGAITRGLLHHKDDIIFGPAMVSAYQIESQLAIYPRIIMDPKIEFQKDIEHDQYQLTYADFDDLTCINMFSLTLLKVAYGLIGFSDNFSEILDVVERLLKEATDNAAKQKLSYLAKYARRTLGGTMPDQDLIKRLIDEVKRGSNSSSA